MHPLVIIILMIIHAIIHMAHITAIMIVDITAITAPTNAAGAIMATDIAVITQDKITSIFRDKEAIRLGCVHPSLIVFIGNYLINLSSIHYTLAVKSCLSFT